MSAYLDKFKNEKKSLLKRIFHILFSTQVNLSIKKNSILSNSLRDLVDQFRNSIIKSNEEQWSNIETALESKHSWQAKPLTTVPVKRGPGRPPNKLPALIPLTDFRQLHH